MKRQIYSLYNFLFPATCKIWWKAALFFTLLMVTPALQAELNLTLPKIDLPYVSATVNTRIGIASERHLGLDIFRKLRGQGSIIEDPEIYQWLNEIGNRLVSHAKRNDNPFYFLVSNDPQINAFATQGGVIVINSGLILKTDNESELAAVIAHEIAHITQRHIARMLEKAADNKFATAAAILAGVAAGTQNAQAGQAIITSTLATQAHKQLKFGREAEAEADAEGLRILSRAGYNPQNMASFLAKLERYADRNLSDIAEFLQQHPLTYKRVSQAESSAKTLPSKSHTSSWAYKLLKEKIAVLTNQKTHVSPIPELQIYRQLLIKNKQQHPPPESLHTSKHTTLRRAELTLAASMYNRATHYARSIQLLKPAQLQSPENMALTLPLAEAYLGLRQRQTAWQLLANIPVYEHTPLPFFQLKQRIAYALGYRASALATAAEISQRRGLYSQAAAQYRQAIKSADANPAEIFEWQQKLNKLGIFLVNKR